MERSASQTLLRAGRRPVRVFFLLLAMVAAIGPALCGEGDQGQVARGERLYRIHCLNCHGESGRGDGPMAAVLKARVPDLTLLGRSHGGTFPHRKVMGSIDGRYRIRGHGLREMPVWGLSFEQRGRDAGREAEVQQRLQDLTAYLESIQRNDAEP